MGQVDDVLLVQLMSMGFPELHCRKALIAVKNSNADAATEWLFAHMEDPDIDDPLPEEAANEVDADQDMEDVRDVKRAATLSSQLAPYLSHVRAPGPTDKVYKDECVVSFDSPESDDGLYVCLQTWAGVGAGFLAQHHRMTGQPLYLRIKTTRKPLANGAQAGSAPTELAIGTDTGFQPDKPKYEIQTATSIVLMPNKQELCDGEDPDLPPAVKKAVRAILQFDSAQRKDEVVAWQDVREVSKYGADLVQVNNGVKVPPTGNKCSRCGLTENLWMNLTDGTILCGRKNFDGTGGNGHAAEYYSEFKYPLAVKLGTITPEGADVYSYPEDDMVTDPKLAEHLAHFGINMMMMEKTEKTMAELELEQNIKHEWSLIQESGADLKKLYGPGFTGMQNLGNSCYMASVMQTLFMVPEFQARFYKQRDALLQQLPADPANDFHVQMAKLAHGLLSGEYSRPLTNPDGSEDTTSEGGVRPLMFKTLVGRGHPEFATMRQQDALDFFLYLMELIERRERAVKATSDLNAVFRYGVEERLQCGASGKVRYGDTTNLILSLPIHLEDAVNKAEVAHYQKQADVAQKEGIKIPDEEVVRPLVPLEACVAAWGAPEELSDWLSPATGTRTVAKKSSRFRTFPPYLMIHARRFYMGEDWQPRKLDVRLDVPDELEVRKWRARGAQPGEELLADGAHEASQPAMQFDPAVMDLLLSAGFSENASKRAVLNNQGQDAEACMNWLFAHLDDADINDPIPNASASAPKAPAPVSEESVAMLTSMGFTEAQAAKALAATDNNLERAADWLFSHAGELDAMDTDQAPESTGSAEQLLDGEGVYELMGFISHMGTSTLCGHYVCHLKKDGRFVLFNDAKVAESLKPPKEYGYLYLYKRKDL